MQPRPSDWSQAAAPLRRRMSMGHVYSIIVCMLLLVPTSRGSPGQVLEVLMRLAEAASGQTKSNGTGCTRPGDQTVNAAVLEYLRIIKNLSEVAVVLDDEGRRPEAATARSAGSSDVDLQSRSMTDKMPNLKKCPPGQMPDRIGKCRKVVFDSKVWST